jgi:hypothetical protein
MAITCKNLAMPITKQLGSKFGFVAGVLSGLAAPSYLYASPHYLAPGSDLHEMRSDWSRIGDDFRAVMARENVKTPPQP